MAQRSQFRRVGIFALRAERNDDSSRVWWQANSSPTLTDAQHSTPLTLNPVNTALPSVLLTERGQPLLDRDALPPGTTASAAASRFFHHSKTHAVRKLSVRSRP